MVFKNPFLKTQPNRPGSGKVHLALLPPANPTYSTLEYTYPLKLVPSTPHILSDAASMPTEQPHEDNSGSKVLSQPISARRPISVPLLFMLSYGGGLLPPDAIDLTIRLDPNTRLTIATQGSTKIFPSEPFQTPRSTTTGQLGATNNSIPLQQAPGNYKPSPVGSSTPLPTATQTLNVHLAAHSALCLTPDPTQPFQGSKYIQRQIFTVDPAASLLLLDWTNEGRRARGESWAAELWRGCNEIWRTTGPDSKPRLQLRDHVILEGDNQGPGDSRFGSGYGMRALREQDLGCFGTLVALGEVVKGLGEFFMQEFEALPRVGGRDWGDEKIETGTAEEDEVARVKKRREVWRKERLRLEKDEGILWTSARVRGLVLIKFGAREAQGARRWLREMLVFEGTVAREFGEGGLMCVR